MSKNLPVVSDKDSIKSTDDLITIERKKQSELPTENGIAVQTGNICAAKYLNNFITTYVLGKKSSIVDSLKFSIDNLINQSEKKLHLGESNKCLMEEPDIVDAIEDRNYKRAQYLGSVLEKPNYKAPQLKQDAYKFTLDKNELATKNHVRKLYVTPKKIVIAKKSELFFNKDTPSSSKTILVSSDSVVSEKEKNNFVVCEKLITKDNLSFANLDAESKKDELNINKQKDRVTRFIAKKKAPSVTLINLDPELITIGDDLSISSNIEVLKPETVPITTSSMVDMTIPDSGVLKIKRVTPKISLNEFLMRDDDVLVCLPNKSANYYLFPKNLRCSLCKQPRHSSIQCPIKRLRCNYCLQKHATDRCPHAICAVCKTWHLRTENCKENQNKFRHPFCPRCKLTGHFNDCAKVNFYFEKQFSEIEQQDIVCLKCSKKGHFSCK